MGSRRDLQRWRQQRAYEVHQTGLSWAAITERLGYKHSTSAQEAAQAYKQRMAAAEASGRLGEHS